MIFNNFAALHFIFYTKEFTFATYFTKKKFFFLGENLSFRGHFRAKKGPFCVVLSAILPVKCDTFFENRVKSSPLPRGNFRHLVSCQLPPLARGKALVQRKPADGVPVQGVDARTVDAEHPLDLMIHALPEQNTDRQPVGVRADTSAGERTVPSARVTPAAKPCLLSSVSGVSMTTV